MLVLMLIVLLVGIAPRHFLRQNEMGSEASEKELAAWTAEINAALKTKRDEPPNKSEAPDKPRPRPFDPNTASAQDMATAGLPHWMADRIVKYRSAGGQFREAEDLKKLYGMTEDMYARVAPLVRIVHDLEPRQEQRAEEESKEVQPTGPLFELNSATAEELTQIRGIGAVLSARIVEYRERLGGYYSYDQLLEVYGLKPEVIALLQEQSTLDSTRTFFNFNADSIKHLSRHPYIDWSLAKVIFNYRQVHGDFTRPEELKNIHILSDSLYQKLRPYVR